MKSDDHTLLSTILLRNGKADGYWFLLMFFLFCGIAMAGSFLLFAFRFAEFLTMVAAKEYKLGAAYQLEISVGAVAVLSGIFAGIVAMAVKQSEQKF